MDYYHGRTIGESQTQHFTKYGEPLQQPSIVGLVYSMIVIESIHHTGSKVLGSTHYPDSVSTFDDVLYHPIVLLQ